MMGPWRCDDAGLGWDGMGWREATGRREVAVDLTRREEGESKI